ncbi:hypothetical protein L1049_022454 [Liquidambar formosana]|uniref:ERCC4 domain-containing protein n=1 Tax=Liquidambar formosana TaxID=63359 RepID=A0AAP0RCJ8_LIQFO
MVPTTSGQNTEASIISKREHDALLAAASGINNLAVRDLVFGDNPQPHVGSEEQGKGRGKGRNKKPSAKVQSSRNKDKDKNSDNKAAINDKSVVSDSENEGQRIESDPGVVVGFHEGVHSVRSAVKGVLRKHSQEVDATSVSNVKPLPPVHFYALESDQHVLDILKPSVIIVYHPDMTFVREIEIYKAENPSKKLKVYFIFYEDSTEVQKFEASIRRENGAFESLIRQKSLMMIPVDQDGRCLGINSSIEPQATTSQNSITRKAGGRKEVEKEVQIIVDMREFMSSLPNVLHQKGMRIIPVTLEVGDYILSPLICVERKSIQDLFMSFTSGRLYHQVETMVRYYRIPVLLIEFSQDKSFSFQANQDEPDEARAIRVGVPSEEGIVENDVRAENYNTSAVEFLRRLPGVTDSNYRALMDGCKSLAELALLPIERLAELMGGQKAARTLRDFLDAKYPTLL